MTDLLLRLFALESYASVQKLVRFLGRVDRFLNTESDSEWFTYSPAVPQQNNSKSHCVYACKRLFDTTLNKCSCSSGRLRGLCLHGGLHHCIWTSHLLPNIQCDGLQNSYVPFTSYEPALELSQRGYSFGKCYSTIELIDSPSDYIYFCFISFHAG